MSLNGNPTTTNAVPTATLSFMPQYATNPQTGQIFMIAPHQHQNGSTYYLPRAFVNTSGGLQFQQPMVQQRFVNQHGQQFQILQSFSQLPQSPSVASIPSQVVPRRQVRAQFQQRSLPAPVQPTAPKLISKQVQAQPPPLSEQSNGKTKVPKEKSISHLVDGQIIIETLKPITEKKQKSTKKKTKLETGSQPIDQSSTNKSRSFNESCTKTIPEISEAYEIRREVCLQAPHVSAQPAQQTSINNSYQSRDHSTHVPKSSSSNVSHDQTDTSEISKIRSEMPNWSVSDVVNFVEQHEDIRQYSSKFAEDEVDGKALLLMIDRNLNFHILTTMFKHGPAMKIEAALAKYKAIDS